MANEKRQQLHPGQMMPDFGLRMINGKSLRISDFRNRNNLVLIFPEQSGQADIAGYLHQLHELENDFQFETTRVLMVLPEGGAAEMDEWVVSDPGGSAYRAVSAADFLPRPGSVAVVVDRFGEINAIFRQEPGEALPPGDVLLEEVRFIELQCPE